MPFCLLRSKVFCIIVTVMKNSNSNNNKSKHGKTAYDRYRPWRHIDIVKYIFIIYMSSFFLVYVDDYYFNITATRAYCFYYGVLGLAIMSCMAMIVETSLMSYYNEKYEFYLDSKPAATPDLWMVVFLLANVISFFMAADKKAAFTGENGRRFGLLMILCVAVCFLILARGVYLNMVNLIVLSAVTAFSYIMAFLQHFGFDPLHFLERVTDNQKEKFIGTFGNLNTFGSYVCIAMPIFAALIIFSEKLYVKVLSGVMVALSAMAMIVSKSDNVYLGLGAAFLLLFFIAIYYKRIKGFFEAILYMAIGLYIMALLSKLFGGSTAHINGIAKLIEKPGFMGAFLLAAFALYVGMRFFEKASFDTYEKIQNKRTMLILGVLLAAAVAFVFIIGIRSGSSLFTFDYKWGTYRGYVWSRSLYAYSDSSIRVKLFGNGNETVRMFLLDYRDEMVRLTKKYYDNCHNEVLQFLVTTGLFGATGYLGTFITSVIYMIRRSKADPVVLALLASSVSYFAQGLVNVNQPITSPLFFVTMAAGIGYIRYRDQGYGVFNKDNNAKKEK